MTATLTGDDRALIVRALRWARTNGWEIAGGYDGDTRRVHVPRDIVVTFGTRNPGWYAILADGRRHPSGVRTCITKTLVTSVRQAVAVLVALEMLPASVLNPAAEETPLTAGQISRDHIGWRIANPDGEWCTITDVWQADAYRVTQVRTTASAGHWVTLGDTTRVQLLPPETGDPR